MKSVLSTKKLTPSQRETLSKAGWSIVEYDAIEVINLGFKVPENIENAIFTSQNAVRSFFENKDVTKNSIRSCFCVGEKTNTLLEENDQNVVKTAKNASELAQIITKEHQNDSFYFFCNNIRRDEIPSILKTAKIELFEVKVYETKLFYKHFDQNWSKILFFSPSGVESFTSENQIGKSLAICIGETTASEAKKHTNKVEIAAETTIESVIKKAIKAH